MDIRKREKIIIICTLASIIGVLTIHLFYKSCTNTEGNFDNDIFWSAISTIVSILGFGGTIYTLLANEKTRISQNKYEYHKEVLMNEQENFRKACFEQIEKINPRRLIDYAKIYEDTKDKEKFPDLIYDYQMSINEFPGTIRFYYKYNDKIYKQFEREFGLYAIKSWNFINNIRDGKTESDIINTFRDSNYEELKKQIIELIDDRQKRIEEELKQIS